MIGDGRDKRVRVVRRSRTRRTAKGEPIPASADCLIGLVDDDPAVRRSLVRLLLAMGFAAADFASAEDLLASGRAQTLCCLLLDVELGEMSGPDLYVQLKKSCVDLPVIFLSASADAEHKVRAMTGRVTEVLTKPVDADYLRAVIARALVSIPHELAPRDEFVDGLNPI